MGLISGLISGIGSGVGGILQPFIDAKTSKINTDKTNQANLEMSKYAYSKDLEMWNKQNQYNSPQEQMNRYKQAGLNPNLIYGQGSSGNATTLPKYSAPRQEYNYKPAINPAMTLSMFTDFAMKQQQTDNMRQQKELLQAEIQAKKIANSLNEAVMPYRIEEAGWRGLKSKYDQEKSWYDTDLSKYSSQIKKNELQNWYQNFQSILANRQAQTLGTGARTLGQDIQNAWSNPEKASNQVMRFLQLASKFFK